MKKFNEPAKRLFIVTCNHNHITGILDHIQLIKQVWDKKSEIVVSDFPVPDQHNLIIEEFTDSEFTFLLREMKSKFPKTKFHILMTEVPSRERVNSTNESGEVLLNVSQFAHVENSLESRLARIIVRARHLMVSGRRAVPAKSWTRVKLYTWSRYWLASAIRFGNRILITFPATPRRKFKQVAKSISKFFTASLPSFQKPNAASMLRLSRYITPKKLQQFASRIPTVIKEQSQIEYFRQRGHALSKTADIFDSWLSMHPAIDVAVLEIFSKPSVTLFPEFDMASVRLKKERTDTLLFASTGAGSIYRDRVLSDISNESRKRQPTFLAKRTGFVTDDHLINNFHATLNIPQTGNWPISSPVRIYRSIVIGLPPIVWKKFKDHPIENCALELRKTLTSGEFYTFTDELEQRVQTYNKIANDLNDKAFETLQIEEQIVNESQIEHFFDRELFLNVQPLLNSQPRLLAEFKTENLVEFNNQMLKIPKYVGEVNFSSKWETLSKYVVNDSSDLISIVVRAMDQSEPILPIGAFNRIPFYASKTSIYKQDGDFSLEPDNNFWPDRESPPTIIGTIASINGLINLVHHRTSVFALPPELGEVDFSDTNQDLNRFQFKKIDTLVDNLHASAGDIRRDEDDKITCVIGSSQFNIHPNRIFKRELKPQTHFKNLFDGPEKLFELGTIFGPGTNYNLLFYGNEVFSIPQSIGDINLKDNSQQFVEYRHQNSASVARFVLNIIDDFRKPQLDEDNKPVKLDLNTTTLLIASFADHKLVSKEGKLFWVPKNTGSETDSLPSLNPKTELPRLLLAEFTNILSRIAKKPVECDEATFCRAIEYEITSEDTATVEECQFTVQNHRLSKCTDGRIAVTSGQGYDIFFKETAQAARFIALKLRSSLSLRNDAFLVASFGTKNLILFEDSLFWIPQGIYFDQNDTRRHEMRIKCKAELQGLIFDEVSNNYNIQNYPVSMCDEAFLINNILLEIERNLQSSNSILSFGKYSFKVAPNGKYTVRSTDDREIVFKNINDTINFLIIKFRDQILVNETPILIASFQEHNLVSLGQQLFWIPKEESFDYKNPEKTSRWLVSNKELSKRIKIETGVSKTSLNYIDIRLFNKNTYTSTI